VGSNVCRCDPAIDPACESFTCPAP
jgi:hypothetical protein